MRMKGRVGKYQEQREYKRQRRAIEWCIRFLKIDLDHMKSREFAKLVKEYESVVIYPNRPNVRRRFQDEDEAITAFKGYQRRAQEFIGKIKELSPGKPIHDKVPRRVVISRAPDGKININSYGHQGFKFSFTEHIARLLNGKKYDDAVCVCPYCKHYFPILTIHKRKYCKRGCAVKDKQRKRREGNPEKERRINRLRTKFSRIKMKYPKDEERKKELNKYFAKHPYSWDEIPQNIRDLYSDSQSTFVSSSYKGD